MTKLNENSTDDQVKEYMDNGVALFDIYCSERENNQMTVAFANVAEKIGFKSGRADGWISVADGLPVHNGGIGCNLGDSVIVDVFADGERWPNCYYSFDDCLWYDSDVYCSISGVTHWMPLPSAPNS